MRLGKKKCQRSLHFQTLNSDGVITINLYIYLFIIFCVLLFPNYALSQTSNEMLFDPTCRYGKLKNGLTYYIKSVPGTFKVEMKMVVRAGYLNEEPSELHLSHVLEHVVAMSAVPILSEMGLSIGANYNANTGYKATNYWIKVPNDERKVKAGLKVLKNWCSRLTLDSNLVESERGRIINEISGGEIPDINIERKIMFDVDQKFFVPYEEILKNVQQFNIRTLIDYYNKFYVPENQAIIIVGDIDGREIEKQIIYDFQDIPKSSQPLALESIANKPNKSNQAFLAVNKTRGQITFTKYFKQNDFKIINENDYRKQLLIDIFNVAMNERFSDFVFEWRDYVIMAIHQYRKWIFRPNMNTPAIVSSIEFKKNISDREIAKLFSAFLEEEERVYRLGLSTDELNNAKNCIHAQISDRKMDIVAERLDRYTSDFLEDNATPDLATEQQFKKALLNTITVDQLNTFIKTLKQNLLPVIIEEDSIKAKPIITKKQVRNLYAAIKSANIKPYTPIVTKSIIAASEIETILKSKVDYTVSHIPEHGITVCKAANGFEVVMKPSKISGLGRDKVYIKAFNLLYSPNCFGRSFASLLLSPIVAYNSGIEGFTEAELKYYLGRNSVDFEFGIGENDVIANQPYFKIEAPKDKIAIGLALLYKRITSPVFKDDALIECKSLLSTSFASSDSLSELISQYSGKEINLSMLSLQDVAIEKVETEYKRTFSSLNGYKIIITGDFDVEKMIADVMTYLGAIPVSSNNGLFRSSSVMPSEGSDSYYVMRNVNDKTAITGHFLTSAKLSLATRAKLLILKSVIRQILFKKLSSEMGICYSLSTEVSHINRSITDVSFSFTTTSNDLSQIKKVVFDEIENIKNGIGIGSFVENAKADIISKIDDPQKQTHEFWQTYFFWQFLNEVNINEIVKYKMDLEKLSVGDIQEVAQRFLNHNDLQEIQLP